MQCHSDGVLSVPGRGKKKHRRLADRAHTFGIGARVLTRREEFGLDLHVERCRYQDAVAVALGIHAALAQSDLDRPFFDAIARTDAEIDELEARANHERHVARVAAKRGF